MIQMQARSERNLGQIASNYAPKIIPEASYNDKNLPYQLHHHINIGKLDPDQAIKDGLAKLNDDLNKEPSIKIGS